MSIDESKKPIAEAQPDAEADTQPDPSFGSGHYGDGDVYVATPPKGRDQ